MREREQLFGLVDEVPPGVHGQTTRGNAKPDQRLTFLVWARDRATLVHELAHVVLDTFDEINSDPREGNGEPFCYLLGQLFEEATGKTT